jgi:hypothetical protein
VKALVLSDKLTLDTVKGNPGSFRPWDHQLRAPVLLAMADAVTERGALAAIPAPDQCTRHARYRRIGDGLSVLA